MVGENIPKLAGELLVAAKHSAPALWKHPKGSSSSLMGISKAKEFWHCQVWRQA